MEQTSTLVNSPDVQAQKPTVHLSLSRVGVTNVEKVIRISRDGREELYWANLECFVDLGPAAEGRAHVALRGDRQRGHRRSHPWDLLLSGLKSWRSGSPSSCASVRTRGEPR